MFTVSSLLYNFQVAFLYSIKGFLNLVKLEQFTNWSLRRFLKILFPFPPRLFSTSICFSTLFRSVLYSNACSLAIKYPHLLLYNVKHVYHASQNSISLHYQPDKLHNTLSVKVHFKIRFIRSRGICQPLCKCFLSNTALNKQNIELRVRK